MCLKTECFIKILSRYFVVNKKKTNKSAMGNNK